MENGQPSKNFLAHLLTGNRAGASEEANLYLSDNHDITDLYEHVIKPALYEVGSLWESNKITVATEHLATAVTEGVLNLLYEKISSGIPSNSGKVVVACVENEMHQVGIKMVADIFEMHGWESLYLGNGVPLQELIEFTKSEAPDILAISLSVYFNFKALQKMLIEFRRTFPDMTILVGGQALQHSQGSIGEIDEKVIYLSDLYLLERFIDSINPKN